MRNWLKLCAFLWKLFRPRPLKIKKGMSKKYSFLFLKKYTLSFLNDQHQRELQLRLPGDAHI